MSRKPCGARHPAPAHWRIDIAVQDAHNTMQSMQPMTPNENNYFDLRLVDGGS